MGEPPPMSAYSLRTAGARRRAINGPSQRCNGSWMISRSANSSSRNGSTASRVAGPPRLSMTMPVLMRPAPPFGAGSDRAPGCSSAARLFIGQPSLQGKPGQARYGPDSELPHQAFPVGFDGAVADAERRRDLLVRVALGDSLQHLALPRGQ